MTSAFNKEDLFNIFAMDGYQAMIPEQFYYHLENMDANYRDATRIDVEEYILESLQRADTTRKSDSDNNKNIFEEGWRENLYLIQKNGITPESLRPRYFRASKFLRYKKDIVITENKNIEYDLFYLARLLLFTRLLSEYDHIYEFGCGSCGNLLMLSDLFPEKYLYGLDWAKASLDITRILRKEGELRIKGYLLDMLNPDKNIKLKPGSAVLTIHSMEQLGNRFGPFLDYLLDCKPSLIIHYEPIQEMYDKDNLFDYLAINYSQKRGYLNGYLSELRALAKKKRIKIIEELRPYVGGVYHEASIVVWQPL